MKNYKDNQKIIIKVNMKELSIIGIVLLIILGLLFYRVFGAKIGINKLSSQAEKFALDNEQTIFKISKIILYSSASAQDHSADEVLQDMDISQYTDISVNIDNKLDIKNLTEKNMVKNMYLDNFNIDIDSDKGEKILNYKNPYIFGKYKILENASNNRVDFKIVKTNQENDEANYDEPIFYTDCSNPISLGYINKNVQTRFSVSENKNSIIFDGKLLKNANVKFEDLNCIISFNIHIINYKDEEFVCPVIIDNDLDNNQKEIYKGNMTKVIEPNSEEFKFIQMK